MQAAEFTTEQVIAQIRALAIIRQEQVKIELEKRLLPGDAEVKAECEASLLAFCRHAWHILEPKSRDFKEGWAMEAMAEHMEAVTDKKILRLLINVPPGILKSMMTKVFWPAWEWGPKNLAHMRYITASYASHLSKRDARKMKRLIESPWFQRLWPHVKLSHDQKTKTNFETTETGFMLASSVSGVATGERADRFICFPYEEMVQTEDGPIAIGRIVNEQMNIRVWSTDTKTGKTSLKPITGWHKNPGSRIVEIKLSDGARLRCTPDHRIWTRRGWVEAQYLKTCDRLPCPAVLNAPDSIFTNPVFLRDGLITQGGSENFKYDFLCQFGIIGCFTRWSIRTLPLSSSNFRPVHATPNTINCHWPNTILGSERLGSFFTYVNFKHLFFSKYGPWPLLINRKSAMRFGISNVLRSCSIRKIFKTVIKRLPVQMPDFHAFRRWADKGQKHNLMHINMGLSRFANHVKAQISFLIISGLQYAAIDFIRLSFAHSHSALASDAALVADAVKTFPSGDRYPVFIRNVGHVDSTFCLSVKDNHTFIVGKGNIIVANCDDPNSVKGAESDTIREGTNEWMKETVPSRINDPMASAIIVIQQRTHEHDVSGYLLSENQDGEYVHLCLPMEFEPESRCLTKIGFRDPRKKNGELLFPERFPAKFVAKEKKRLGPYAASAQFQQSPTPRGGGIITLDDWQMWDASNPEAVRVAQSLGLGNEFNEFPAMEFVVGSLDTAYTEDEENDYSANTVWGVWRHPVSRQPHVMLIGSMEERLQINPLVLRVGKMNARYHVSKQLIETKAAGHSVAQELRRLFSATVGVVLITIGGGRGKPSPIIHRGDKAARAYTVQHIWTNGQVWRPNRAWADRVAQQLSRIPKTAEDDLADTAIMAVRWLRDVGFLLTPAEGTGEVEIYGKALQEQQENPYDV